MPLSDLELHSQIRQVLKGPGVPWVTNAGDLVDPARMAGMIDHTLLKPNANDDQVRELCAQALEYAFAAVCVNPAWVPLCAALLEGSSVAVATTIGFPLGATLAEAKAQESKLAVAAGARELDMVINIGALKSGLYHVVADDVAAVVQAAHPNASVKVIIEACYLTDEEKVAACLLAQAAGADYVKTSTGFGPGGATIDDVMLMRRAVGPQLGVKAAGGIRSATDALAMAAAGATRIGTSAGIKIVGELMEKAAQQG
jgi:deoxyribose-phosphate aldolase